MHSYPVLPRSLFHVLHLPWKLTNLFVFEARLSLSYCLLWEYCEFLRLLIISGFPLQVPILCPTPPPVTDGGQAQALWFLQYSILIWKHAQICGILSNVCCCVSGRKGLVKTLTQVWASLYCDSFREFVTLHWPHLITWLSRLSKPK